MGLRGDPALNSICDITVAVSQDHGHALGMLAGPPRNSLANIQRPSHGHCLSRLLCHQHSSDSRRARAHSGLPCSPESNQKRHLLLRGPQQPVRICACTERRPQRAQGQAAPPVHLCFVLHTGQLYRTGKRNVIRRLASPTHMASGWDDSRQVAFQRIPQQLHLPAVSLQPS